MKNQNQKVIKVKPKLQNIQIMKVMLMLVISGHGRDLRMSSVLFRAHIQLSLRDVQALTRSGRDHGRHWRVEKALLRGGATFGCGQGRLKTQSL